MAIPGSTWHVACRTGLFLVLTFFSGVPGTIVLCRGDNGHVAIELANEDGCVSCFDGDVHYEVPQLEQGDHCGPCVDTSLALAPLDRVHHTEWTIAAGPVLLTPPWAPVTMNRALCHARFGPIGLRPPPGPAPILAALTTVFLLI
ncbi:hypothetical protein SCOR_31490 [Sulfidibacter corallicola]